MKAETKLLLYLVGRRLFWVAIGLLVLVGLDALL